MHIIQNSSPAPFLYPSLPLSPSPLFPSPFPTPFHFIFPHPFSLQFPLPFSLVFVLGRAKSLNRYDPLNGCNVRGSGIIQDNGVQGEVEGQGENSSVGGLLT